MLHAKNVPSRFWAECMKTAVYVTNRLPQPRLGFVSPFQKLWNIKPTVSHLRVFGCVCYVFIPDHLRSKFDKKAHRCIFVGYDNERKGWRCCDPTTGRCYISRNVVFDEASSWWSSQEVVLPDSKELEIKLQDKLGEQPQENEAEPEQVATEEQKAPTDGDATQPNSSETRGRSVSPWRTGVHQETPEELRPSQQEEVQETSEPPLPDILILYFRLAYPIPFWNRSLVPCKLWINLTILGQPLSRPQAGTVG